MDQMTCATTNTGTDGDCHGGVQLQVDGRRLDDVVVSGSQLLNHCLTFSEDTSVESRLKILSGDFGNTKSE